MASVPPGGDMHHSRLCAFVIDCKVDDLDAATEFWSRAFGRPANPPDADSPNYRELKTGDGEPMLLVQKVGHPSRVHLDIETDDIEAEVKRLEALGAKRVEFIKRWWVMEAPSGQRFCVVRPQRGPLEGRANVWGDEGA
ncbi:VOC family protein [Pyxidicoccus caerfyrddinensis]|uniref:VOC family protein n=1 Tax=Pyxidicoccus caerfyrddinensis TaxID=2709663 RepID=UPI0023DE06D1|nr:VOC family protein [Pyxidicoccus caerfyrddinensis]